MAERNFRREQPNRAATAPKRAQHHPGAGQPRDRVSRGLEGLRRRRRRARPGDLRRSTAASSCSSSAPPARASRRSCACSSRSSRRRPAGHRGRPRPGRDHAQAGPLLPPQHRRGLPGLQAAAEPHGLRQRRLRAAGHRPQAPGDPREGARHPAPHRPVDEAAQLPRPALGRRAAARLDRARVRQPPAAAAVRRADRQPRPRDVDRDHAAALPDQPHRHDGARRHPRQRTWSTRCAGA